MADREKLFDLMMRDPCPSPVICAPHCKYYKSHHCHAERYADHLIANGVTFATDNNVGGNDVPDNNVGKWIPVTERLPEPCEFVLSYAGHGTLYEVDGVDEKGNWVSSYISEYPVTHWMPLPEPPKGE